MAGGGHIYELSNGIATQMPGDIPDLRLNDLWGSSADNIFAVGQRGTILHFDGSTWQLMQSGTDAILDSVWGMSPRDVFVAGSTTPFDGPTRYYAATMLRYNGDRWRRLESEGVSGELIWGSKVAGLFAASGAQLSEFASGRWIAMQPQPTFRSISDLAGLPNGDILMVGDGVTRIHVERTE
jgi:hypothetical protein